MKIYKVKRSDGSTSSIPVESLARLDEISEEVEEEYRTSTLSDKEEEEG